MRDPSQRPSRRHAGVRCDERGFTLVELLVVILIIGILAVVALPAFFNQRAKGQDTEARHVIHAAEVALATFQQDAGTYAASAADLVAVEPSLATARNLQVSGTADSWQLSADSSSGSTFTLTRDAAGDLTRTCATHGSGLCRAAADAQGDWW